jgi:hypothetical protein
MTDLGSYESLLNQWRDAEAKAEQVRQFFENGGAFRLRIAVINDGPVVTSIMGDFLNDMMRGKGFEAMAKSAINRAEQAALTARAAMLGMAANASSDTRL